MRDHEYQQLASKTLSCDYEKIKSRMNGPTGTSLMFLMDDIAKMLKMLDEFKKYVFYGKESWRVERYCKNTYWFNQYAGIASFEINVGKAKSMIESSKTIDLVHGIIGVGTELEELMYVFNQCPDIAKIDNVNIMEETGDIFWYLNAISKASGFTFGQAKEKNIQKLQLRYKDKFTESEAINRDHNKERQILEG